MGFTFTKTKKAEFIIHHNGRRAAVLRGKRALAFREDMISLSFADLQQLMARLTGNYKHGNERTAKNHPRNRS
ncbi:MAG: hypothetical protein HKM93_04510 [Desulfobacteraceae bacterium]|nr:hypothetical protein [Desulfobacteraceae bacterium]